jgi:hypothetical protein
MANTVLTSSVITKEALRILHSKLTFVGNINRQYDSSFAKSGAKIGDTLKIRLPNQYTVRTGKTLSTQDTTETNTTLQVATQKGVDVNFSSAELTMSLDDFSSRILEPAMAVLAANIEADALNMYKDVYNLVGTAGTVPTGTDALKVYLQARQKLNENLAPMDNNRTMHLLPISSVEIVNSLKGLFNDTKAISEQYREGEMGRTAGFDWYENTLLPTHTIGNKVASLTVSGGSQTGASLLIGGTANNDTFKAGTVFTIAGVYQVHPESKATMASLQQFVVTADVTATTTTATIGISPPIVTSGATQNVSASPAGSAAITVVGSASTGYGQNLAFHKDAFSFATADLILPQGVDFARREVYDGISMRIVRAYDINNDNLPCRIDVLYGYKTLRPQMACRVTN